MGAGNKAVSNRLNWSYALFVENPFLYLPFLEDQKKSSKKEVDGIVRLIRENNIVDGCKILDFSCGIGRHSIELAKRGYEVIGYDPSNLFLDIARKNSAEEITETSSFPIFYQGSPYSLSKVFDKNNYDFEVIIIMDNSIGYSGMSNDIIMLRELHKVAGRKCVLIIESENRDWRLRNFESNVIREFDKMVINQKWNFNLESSESESLSLFYEKVNSEGNDLRLLLKLNTSMRIYSLHELIKLLEDCGWRYSRSYNSILDLNPANINSGPNMVTVSKFG